jgi:hypothetical protein
MSLPQTQTSASTAQGKGTSRIREWVRERGLTIGIIVATFVLALAFVIVMTTLTISSVQLVPSSPLTAASAIALIAAAAVAIERIIEAIWTFVGLTAGSWAPLSSIGTTINTLLSESNTALAGYQVQAKQLVEKIDEQIEIAKNKLAQVEQSLKELQGKPDTSGAALTEAQQAVTRAWDELQGLKAVQSRKAEISDVLKKVPSVQPQDVRSTQDALLHATRLAGTLDYLQKVLPRFQEEAALARQSVATLSTFIDSFKDNPARRLISIYIGTLIGLIAAWALRLDVFQATLQPTSPVSGLGVALTGLLIGLGANPTHQVIRLLEEFKKSQKAKNIVNDQNI